MNWTAEREAAVKARCKKAKHDVLYAGYWDREGSWHRHYRTDLPDALAEIERLRRVVDSILGSSMLASTLPYLNRKINEAMERYKQDGGKSFGIGEAEGSEAAKGE